jgi:hypothetical protein
MYTFTSSGCRVTSLVSIIVASLSLYYHSKRGRNVIYITKQIIIEEIETTSLYPIPVLFLNL